MVWPSLRPPHQWQADVPSARAPLAAVTHATTHVRAPWLSLAIPGQPRSSHVTCANVSPALHRPPSLCRDRAMTWGPCQPPPRGGPRKHPCDHPSVRCSALVARVAESWPGTRATRTRAAHSPCVHRSPHRPHHTNAVLAHRPLIAATIAATATVTVAYASACVLTSTATAATVVATVAAAITAACVSTARHLHRSPPPLHRH